MWQQKMWRRLWKMYPTQKWRSTNISRILKIIQICFGKPFFERDTQMSVSIERLWCFNWYSPGTCFQLINSFGRWRPSFLVLAGGEWSYSTCFIVSSLTVVLIWAHYVAVTLLICSLSVLFFFWDILSLNLQITNLANWLASEPYGSVHLCYRAVNAGILCGVWLSYGYQETKLSSLHLYIHVSTHRVIFLVLALTSYYI